tara:strand:+ start:531 stop:761 length:231 start_codon:yes stop_codon:yes gene_type:complete
MQMIPAPSRIPRAAKYSRQKKDDVPHGGLQLILDVLFPPHYPHALSTTASSGYKFKRKISFLPGKGWWAIIGNPHL